MKRDDSMLNMLWADLAAIIVIAGLLGLIGYSIINIMSNTESLMTGPDCPSDSGKDANWLGFCYDK